ncbi:MAG TPA: SCO family protein [Opitutales bacterium]|nr:SCO family protein [Opitutales bacterium]
MAHAQTVRARVLAIDPNARSYTLEAQPTPLQAAVGPGDAQVPYTGHWIEAQMLKTNEGLRLEAIWPADPQMLSIMAQLNNELRRDTVARGSKVFRAQGEFMPRFAQFDNNGALFTQDSLMGKYTVLNFIFTRCQNPVMCPASTQRMADLQKRLREAGFMEKTQLVSISLDPSYDTPGILTQYILSQGIDGTHHRFLTGP